MPSYSQIIGRGRMFRGYSYLSRLPEHYYRHLVELDKPGVRVHDDPEPSDFLDYKIVDPKTLRLKRVPDLPVNVIYPKEADEGIWGGEGIIKGFHNIVYSEILDKYMRVTMTKRAIELIDNAQGLDNYLLGTPVQDLKSRLALHLRRKLLISLAKEDYYPDDPDKRQYIKEKYKKFVIPLEEAEYVGLTVYEAVTKLKITEAQNYQPLPLKVRYTKELVSKLQKMKETGEIEPKVSLTDKISGLFRKRDSKTDETSSSS